jgi:hypothetical protein
MDTWKHGKPYALIVCPIFQLPSNSSQIYQQAATRSVCVFSYTHLAVLLRYALSGATKEASCDLMKEVFTTVEALSPSKDAVAYWQAVNRTILSYDSSLRTSRR